MNRRSFLGLLGGLGAASATSYFFAPMGGWSVNQPVPQWDNTEYWRKMMRLSYLDTVRGRGHWQPYQDEFDALTKEIVAYENQPRLELKLVSPDEVWTPKPVRAWMPNPEDAMRFRDLDDVPDGYHLDGNVWVPDGQKLIPDPMITWYGLGNFA